MLFKDTNKLKEYCELTGNINFTSIKSTLRHAEEVHLIPILGKELYNTLNVGYTDGNKGALSEALQDLLERCRRVLAPYFAYYYAPKADVKLDDGGLRRLETAQSKTGFQYQGKNYREANLREAEQQSELLLEFLDENKADYSEWTDSKAFTQYKQLFIKTAFEFNELFPSHSPYRNYWAMRSKMLQVEQLHIKKAIGAALFADLKTKDQDGNLSDIETELLFKLKNAIAYFTVSFSIPYLSVRIDANGITVSETGGSNTNDELSKLKSAADNQLSLIIRSAQSSGETWLNDAIDFLKENSADFNNWNTEEDTVQEDGTQPITDLNTGLTGSFIL